MEQNISTIVDVNVSHPAEKSFRRIYPAPPTEIRICEICLKPFTCHPREWAGIFRKRRTCSRACGAVLSGRLRIYLFEQPCDYCSKIFKPINKGDSFCSRPCYWQSRKGKPTYIPPLAERIEVVCPQCGNIHIRPIYEVKHGRRFCSRECYRIFRATQGLGTCFPRDGQNDFYLSALWSQLKRQIKRRDQYQCQICTRQFRYNSPGMVVHHIRPRDMFQLVGDHLHEEADTPANLITLCKSCHQKTHAGLFPQFLDIEYHAPQQLRLLA